MRLLIEVRPRTQRDNLNVAPLGYCGSGPGAPDVVALLEKAAGTDPPTMTNDDRANQGHQFVGESASGTQGRRGSRSPVRCAACRNNIVLIHRAARGGQADADALIDHADEIRRLHSAC